MAKSRKFIAYDMFFFFFSPYRCRILALAPLRCLSDWALNGSESQVDNGTVKNIQESVGTVGSDRFNQQDPDNGSGDGIF